MKYLIILIYFFKFNKNVRLIILLLSLLWTVFMFVIYYSGGRIRFNQHIRISNDNIKVKLLSKVFLGWTILPKGVLFSINTDLSGIGYYIGLILGITIAIWKSEIKPIYKYLLIATCVLIMFFFRLYYW